MTDHFFSTLRWCNATLITETVNGSSADGSSSLDFALQGAGDQLEKDMIEFRKSQARPGDASYDEEAMCEMILGSVEANLLSAVKGDSTDFNFCGKMRENIEQKFVQNRPTILQLIVRRLGRCASRTRSHNLFLRFHSGRWYVWSKRGWRRRRRKVAWCPASSVPKMAEF